MITLEQFFNFWVNFDLWLLVKFLVLTALFVYLFFAVLIIRVVNLMNQTIKGVFSLPIKIVALIHLFFSIFVFIMAIIIL